MTFRRLFTRADTWVVICDSGKGSRCDRELATQESEFKHALEVLRRCGWHTFKNTGAPGYGHTCPRCPVAR